MLKCAPVNEAYGTFIFFILSAYILQIGRIFMQNSGVS